MKYYQARRDDIDESWANIFQDLSLAVGDFEVNRADIWSPLNLQVENEFVFLLLSQLIKMMQKKKQTQKPLERWNWSTIF